MGLQENLRHMMSDRDRRCAAIIHGASAAAGTAAAAAVIPGSDSIAIAPVQTAMIIALAREYDIPLTESAVRSALWASLGTMMGKGSSGLLLRWLPVYGNVVRTGVAVSITQALGWTVVKKLKSGTKLI